MLVPQHLGVPPLGGPTTYIRGEEARVGSVASLIAHRKDAHSRSLFFSRSISSEKLLVCIRRGLAV